MLLALAAELVLSTTMPLVPPASETGVGVVVLAKVTAVKLPTAYIFTTPEFIPKKIRSMPSPPRKSVSGEH